MSIRTTDVYAASVVLWEALTGRRLFFAENEARTLANVLYPKVEPPSRIARGVSTALDAIVMRGLDPNPAARFATAREMARALQMTIPPAPSFAVGDWVESTAGTTIQSRASRVASIERTLPPDSELNPPSSPAPVSSIGLRTVPAAQDSRPSSLPPAPHSFTGSRIAQDPSVPPAAGSPLEAPSGRGDWGGRAPFWRRVPRRHRGHAWPTGPPRGAGGSGRGKPGAGIAESRVAQRAVARGAGAHGAFCRVGGTLCGPIVYSHHFGGPASGRHAAAARLAARRRTCLGAAGASAGSGAPPASAHAANER